MTDSTKRGKLIIISGPSGVGKGTIIKELFLEDDNLFYSVSATTRNPRPGETDGIEYYFYSKEQFKKMIESGEMLEYAVYSDNYYGTPASPVDKMLESGKNVILEIEVEGAAQVKQARAEAISIMILPPSKEELLTRLRGRGTETEEVIAKRIAAAEREMSMADKYDYRVINDQVCKAKDEIKKIINE